MLKFINISMILLPQSPHAQQPPLNGDQQLIWLYL